ncbi:hypothetical protein ASE94_01870 [Devosia sp. Leaf64]|nr:hypothetical protein ASE94_01870 [Devosia sp. Leaf64]
MEVIRFFNPKPYEKSLIAQLHGLAIEKIETAKNYICNIDDADWWIEKGNQLEAAPLLCRVIEEMADRDLPEKKPALVVAVDLETLLRPEAPVSETVGRVIHTTGRLTMDIDYPEKREDFNEAVKAFNPRWDAPTRRWVFEFREDQMPDIAAEVVAHLVGSGFVLRVKDTALRELVQSGEFKKSDGRRIDYAGGDFLRIDWHRIDGDYYEEVRKLVGSKWDRENRTVLVPIGSIDDIRDFASKFGFPMTDLAIKAAEAFDEFRRSGMIEGKKRAKGKAAPILDRKVFPDTIKINPDLLD